MKTNQEKAKELLSSMEKYKAAVEPTPKGFVERMAAGESQKRNIWYKKLTPQLQMSKLVFIFF